MELPVKIVRNSKLFSMIPTSLFLRGFVAISFGLTVRFKGEFDPRIFRHELIHLSQQHRLGIVKFGWQYLAYFFKNFKTMKRMTAYREIEFEKEARKYDNEGAWPTSYEKTLEYEILERNGDNFVVDLDVGVPEFH